MVKHYAARINTDARIYHASKSPLDFHGNLRKIHLNQLSDLGWRAKLPTIFNGAVRAGTKGREFRLLFRVVGDDAIVSESKACITLAESISATQPLSAVLSL
jgi:hypothetical protein